MFEWMCRPVGRTTVTGSLPPPQVFGECGMIRWCFDVILRYSIQLEEGQQTRSFVFDPVIEHVFGLLGNLTRAWSSEAAWSEVLKNGPDHRTWNHHSAFQVNTHCQVLSFESLCIVLVHVMRQFIGSLHPTQPSLESQSYNITDDSKVFRSGRLPIWTNGDWSIVAVSVLDRKNSMHLPLDRATTLLDRVTTPVNPSRPCYNICTQWHSTYRQWMDRFIHVWSIHRSMCLCIYLSR